MKKSIWIFLLAVLLPSVVLGWLALRSAEEQQIILEKRTAELYQKETENAASAVRALIDGERRAFNDVVRRLLARKNPREAAKDFNVALAAAWPRKAVGFALGKEGRLIAPSAESARRNAEVQKFLLENSAFLCSTVPATVYWISGDDLSRPDVLRKKVVPEIQLTAKNAEPQPTLTFGGNGGKLPISLSINGNLGTTANNEAPVKALEKEGGDTAATRRPVSIEVTRADGIPAAPAAAPALPFAVLAPVATPAAILDFAKTAASPMPSAEPPATAVPAEASASRMPRLKPLERSKTKAESTAAPVAPTAAAPAPLVATAADKLAPLRTATNSGALRVKEEVAPAPIPPMSRAATKDVRDSMIADDSANPAKTGEASMAGHSAAARKKQQPVDQAAVSQANELRPMQSQSELMNNVRNVAPQNVPEGGNVAALSQIMPSNAEFRTLTAGATEGVVTRFVQDRLDVLFWVRPAQDPEMIFGCLIESENLGDLWPAALPPPDTVSYREPFSGRGKSDFALALLDDKARPVATQPPEETGRDWKRPFVASEIGEALPHWEAALYLQRPEQLRESALAVRRSLTFLIAGALAAIACGGWLVVADARRQLALAQQKTDFVSNVSHELKTPLTSIRMFAELMQGGRPETVAKHPQYLRIIMVEAERLTRLINNVLDFARIERRQKRFDKKPLDLHEVIGRIWEGHELHLREAGFTTRWEAAPAPYPVIGDEDALAQILVNLLSNAEKYSGERKEVELQTYIDGARVFVSVLDRGLGVPAGEERKIFEAFYRAHDSLSCGIQGSGLGLTLAQRLAREHGGEVLYQAREGGGSNFTLRLPLAPQPSAPAASL